MYTNQDVAAELEYLRELIAHGVLEVLGLHLSHLPTREIKDLLTVGGVCVCVLMRGCMYKYTTKMCAHFS